MKLKIAKESDTFLLFKINNIKINYSTENLKHKVLKITFTTKEQQNYR